MLVQSVPGDSGRVRVKLAKSLINAPPVVRATISTFDPNATASTNVQWQGREKGSREKGSKGKGVSPPLSTLIDRVGRINILVVWRVPIDCRQRTAYIIL